MKQTLKLAMLCAYALVICLLSWAIPAHADSAAELSANKQYTLKLSPARPTQASVTLSAGDWLIEGQQFSAQVLFTFDSPQIARPISLFGADRSERSLSYFISLKQATTLHFTITLRKAHANSPHLKLSVNATGSLSANARRAHLLQNQLHQIDIEAGEKQLTRAYSLSRDVLAAWQQQGAIRQSAEAAMSASAIALALSKRGEALELGEQAVTLFRGLNEEEKIGFTLNRLGFINIREREFDRAKAQLDQANSIFGTLYPAGKLNPARGNLCYRLMSMRELKDAHECYLALLPIAEQDGDYDSLAIFLNNIAGTFAMRNQPVDAIKYLELALERRTQAGDAFERARLLNNIGLQYRRMSRTPTALNYYLQALPVFEELKERRQQARVLHNIGIAYLRLGVAQQAISFLNDAYEIRQTIGDEEVLALSMNNLGAAWQAVGDFDQARALHLRAQHLSEQRNDERGRLLSLSLLARTDLATSRPAQARDILSGVAEAYRQQSNSELSLSGTLHYLGIAQRALNQHTTALATLNEALELRNQVGYQPGQAETLSAMARTHRELGHADQAMDAAQAAVKLIVSLRTEVSSPDLLASYQASVADTYEILITLWMERAEAGQSGALEKALETAERYRAQTLIEVLTRNAADNISNAPPELHSERDRLRAEINRRANLRLRGRFDDTNVINLVAQLDVVDEQIAAIDPRFKALNVRSTLDARAMQALLDPESVAIQYFLGREQSFAWVITPTSIESFRLPQANLIATQARQTHAAISRRSADLRVARSLADSVLRPLRGAIEHAKQVTIIADGPLHYIPFDMLYVSGDSSPVLQDKNLTYLPSLTTLALVREQITTAKRGNVAVLADPVFSELDSRVNRDEAVPEQAMLARTATRDLNRLALSGQEAEFIRTLVPPSQLFIRTGFEANTTTLKAQELRDAQIVHIAAHGFANDEVPALSGLALSMRTGAGEPTPGFVGLRDIYDLRLSADLVVLSACETALGRELAGEGLLGLTRGFMYAGAKRVVASLWQVEDRATAELMKHFYAALLQEHMTPAAALRVAKQRLRSERRWRHPFYWSGFVLQGDWRALK